ncbi:hypothetical protein [Sinanaerobacter chloroacetimidivorans]|jgi:translation elongation factor EF-Ts|uniref:Uncharacterized protein n=1 Tax=Sinanaerobacter chloroacetimidivorans TaxID=2818044 RepID=A0A8J8B2J4_9FIRM|nr:hypothetical protein [Sinanaerobacter chloroacetimidivorans]MBR0598792.1 hypothetical protein [Sinanaerobacter chloroacetimidivorans]
MVTNDQVEKLCDYARISYEDAKSALNKTEGDVIEALIDLEQLGKVAPMRGRSPQGSSALLYSALFML